MLERNPLVERSFSYDLEKNYYRRNWPVKALPYEHLEPYLRCWLQPEEEFGGKRVLDIGAGECTYTRLIAERFGPKQIVACDLFRERMLPAALANVNPTLNFAAGDILRLPFREDSFDVVFGSLVLHQIPKLDEVIAEIRRVLSSGGCYVGIEPNPHHLVHLVRYVLGNRSLNQYLLGPKHIASFGKAGFDVIICHFYAKFPKIRNRFFGTCMGILARLQK